MSTTFDLRDYTPKLELLQDEPSLRLQLAAA